MVNTKVGKTVKIMGLNKAGDFFVLFLSMEKTISQGASKKRGTSTRYCIVPAMARVIDKLSTRMFQKVC
jgi:hypothetical protein